jgi:DNA-binding Lrp family transcriptional regulator
MWGMPMKIYLGLQCKVGTPRRVLKKLLDINIPGGDIFLLFGPLDILIELEKVPSLEGYIKKWLKPISMIGAEEGLIAETLTLIVGQESPPLTEVPYAFIFVNTKPPAFEDVRRSVLAIPEVLCADLVFGPYDIICPVRAKNRLDLERVLLNIQTSSPDIEQTMTCIVKEVY